MVRLTVGYRWICLCGWGSGVLTHRGQPSPGAIPVEAWDHVKDCVMRGDHIMHLGVDCFDVLQDVTVVEIQVLAPYEISYAGARRLNRR